MTLLLDLSHTSHTRARTGVQRVARALHRTLSMESVPVCFDPYADAWRPLEPFEKANLASADPGKGRGARWTLAARTRGRLRRLLSRPNALAGIPPPGTLGPAGVIVPEIFSAAVGASLPRLFGASAGPRVALFHDALALQFPEFTPRSTRSRFPGYMTELLQFDGIAAVSAASRDALVGYWRWLGVSRVPPVEALTLGIDPAPPRGAAAAPGVPPTVLCVGSIEGRKNHRALLEACDLLWSRDVRFTLHLVGLANTETGGPALELLGRLRSQGRPIRYDGPLGDAALESAYRACAFTVYPSLAEGFGLPVAESLAREKPCLCKTDGALGEISGQGGCVGIGGAGAPEIASAMERLLASPAELASLGAAARSRQFKTWTQYTAELLQWMKSLRRLA